MIRPEDLNDNQWQAVAHDGSHVIIAAGPGTGKTHTITYRIARTIEILKEGQQVLAITFTNKAARDMQERLEGKVPEWKQHVVVGTFHRAALMLLREFAEQSSLPKDFQIALPEDLQSLLEEIFPDKTSSERKETLEEISLIKSTKLAIDPSADYQTYHRFLRAKNLIDFDDILREALLLLENEEILQQVQRRFPYIFVDEYQDVNLIQMAFLRALVGDKTLITAIGDPNQSIYGFRGSQVRFFSEFDQDFKGAAKFYLKDNYRSSVNLVSAGSQVISKSKTQNVPAAVAQIYEEGRLVVHEAATDRAEAEYVVHQIEQLVGGVSMYSRDPRRVDALIKAKRSFTDIAILYRLNTQKNAIISALDHLGIPYSVASKHRAKKKDMQGLGQDTKDALALQQFEETLEYNVEKVSLLTLHAAKGLEFPVVFIIGCEAKLLPLEIEEMKGDFQEERRLFYVGMTRAKEHLYLTRAERRQIYGKTYFNTPSVFLSDIEENLKMYENSKLQRKGSRVKETDNQQLKLF